MRNYNNSTKCNSGNYCEYLVGNSNEITLYPNDCEVKANIFLTKKNIVKLFGQVFNHNGIPVEGAQVKLFRITFSKGSDYLTAIAHTVSDNDGYYEFEVDNSTNYKYKIVVTKVVYEKDKPTNTKHNYFEEKDPQNQPQYYDYSNLDELKSNFDGEYNMSDSANESSR